MIEYKGILSDTISNTNEIIIDEWKIGVESNTRIEISMPDESSVSSFHSDERPRH